MYHVCALQTNSTHRLTKRIICHAKNGGKKRIFSNKMPTKAKVFRKKKYIKRQIDEVSFFDRPPYGKFFTPVLLFNLFFTFFKLYYLCKRGHTSFYASLSRPPPPPSFGSRDPASKQMMNDVCTPYPTPPPPPLHRH